MNRIVFVSAIILPLAAEAQVRRARPADRYEPISESLWKVAPEARYQEYLREIAAIPGPTAPCPGAPDSYNPRNPLRRCKGDQRDRAIIVPPLQLIEVDSDGETWVPATQFQGGAEQLAKWMADAQSSVLECRDDVCSFKAFGVVPDGWAIERLLVSCVVAKAFSTDEPPVCTMQAAITKAGSYLPAKTCFGDGCGLKGAGGEEDFRFRLEFSSPGALNSIRTAAQRSLEALQLEAVARKADVVGRAKYRPSPVIQNWRDYITVRVSIEEGEAPGLFYVSVATTIYVNRQNTDRPNDWHLPSDQQQATYVAALSKSLQRELGSVCPGGTWRDAETLSCGR